jgi:hypothetical protein
VAVCPGERVAELEDPEAGIREKSCTVRLTVVVWTTDPEVALIVIV